MALTVGEIIGVKLNSGEEIIGEISVILADSTIKQIKNPLLIGMEPNRDGSKMTLGLLPMMPYSKDSIITLGNNAIMATTTPADDIIKVYKDRFSAIITPDKSKVITGAFPNLK